MARLRFGGAAKWALLALLTGCLALPLCDVFLSTWLRQWSPLYYLDFIARSMSFSLDLFTLAAGALALLGWGLMAAGRPAGKIIFVVLFVPAATIYLILFLYVSLTVFFRNRHNTFFIEVLRNFVKLCVSSGVLFLQHIWSRDSL